MNDHELSTAKEGLSEEGKELHEQLLKDKTKSPHELVRDAQEMIRRGKTYNILIPQGGRIDIAGVPFTVSRIKEHQLTLSTAKGYQLVKDTPAARQRLQYDSEKAKKEMEEEKKKEESDE